jgi:CBS domain-containing protein
LDKLGDRVQQTIDQANIGTRPLVTIPAEFRAVDAFVMLIEHRISAVGFLGEEGDVHGNVSIKDIKGLLLDFNNLLLPVHEYINIIRNETIKVFLLPVDQCESVLQRAGKFRNLTQPVALLSVQDTLPMINVHTSDIRHLLAHVSTCDVIHCEMNDA